MSTFIDGSLTRGEALRLLTLQDVAIRGFAAAWPTPRWIKVWRDGEPEPVMAWLNGAYASWYDIDPREYMAKPDSAVWPPEVCARFLELDLTAIARAGEIVMGVEPTPRGKRESSLSRKFAARIDDSGITGWVIYGEICPLDEAPCSGCPKKENNHV